MSENLGTIILHKFRKHYESEDDHLLSINDWLIVSLKIHCWNLLIVVYFLKKAKLKVIGRTKSNCIWTQPYGASVRKSRLNYFQQCRCSVISKLGAIIPKPNSSWWVWSLFTILSTVTISTGSITGHCSISHAYWAVKTRQHGPYDSRKNRKTDSRAQNPGGPVGTHNSLWSLASTLLSWGWSSKSPAISLYL